MVIDSTEWWYLPLTLYRQDSWCNTKLLLFLHFTGSGLEKRDRGKPLESQKKEKIMTRVEQVEVRKPSWKWRLMVSLLIIVVSGTLQFAYGSVQGPLESAAAVQQLEDSAEAYAVARTWAASDITGAIKWIARAFLACIWISYVYGLAKYDTAKKQL